MENTLAQIAPLAQKDKGPAYVSVVHEVFRSDQPTVAADIRLIVETVLQDNVVVGRQVLSELAKCLGEGAIKNAELRKEIVQDTLTAVQPRLVSYEEQVSLCTLSAAVECSIEMSSAHTSTSRSMH